LRRTPDTLAYSLGFTGLAIREWLGLGIGLALLLHLTVHWDWVVRTTRRLLSRGGRDQVIWPNHRFHALGHGERGDHPAT
jgi:hypothetical protein